MDKLAKEAGLAWDAKMSYGKWKALQPIKEIQTKVKNCAWCGGFIAGKAVKGKYCSTECKNTAELGEKNCIRCGKPFPITSHRRRYCTNACAAVDYYYRRKERDGNA